MHCLTGNTGMTDLFIIDLKINHCSLSFFKKFIAPALASCSGWVLQKLSILSIAF
jgi:hypothetical protein